MGVRLRWTVEVRHGGRDLHGWVEDAAHEDEAARDGAVVDFGFGEGVSVVEKDIVGAVQQDRVDKCHAYEERYHGERSHLVFAKK